MQEELSALRSRVRDLERELAERDGARGGTATDSFRTSLYEAMLYGLGRTMSLYDPLSMQILVREMGRHIREYLEELGYHLGSATTPDAAVEKAVAFFASHGFVKLEMVENPEEKQRGIIHAFWRQLLGLRAYERILASGGQTFISCPLNAVIEDALEPFGKTLVLLEKRFDLAQRCVETWEEMVDAPTGATTARALSLDPERLMAVGREQSRQLRLRDEFIRIASHELATPLTSMKLALGLLERAGLTEGAQRRVAELRRQVARLDDLVSQMLDTTRLQIGRLDLQRKRVDLVAVVEHAMDLLEGSLPPTERRIRLERGGGAVTGFWDCSRTDQVVMNLLTNALKYGEGRPVEVRALSDGGVARLTVTDHGIGIPEADKGRIFDPFERVSSVEQHYKGLGLGLFIVRKIVEMHGGRISVESRPGEGSTFAVELPVGAESRSS